MKIRVDVAIGIVAGILLGWFVAKLFFPRVETHTEIRERVDSVSVALARWEADSLRGILQDARVRVRESERLSASWINRANRLSALADSMRSSRDSLLSVVASLDTVVQSKEGYRDTAGVAYDVGRDLWLRLQFGFQERRAQVILRDSIVYQTETKTECPIEWIAAIVAAVALAVKFLF